MRPAKITDLLSELSISMLIVTMRFPYGGGASFLRYVYSLLNNAYLRMISIRCGLYLEDCQRQVFRGLVIRVLFIFQVVPDLPRLACVQMRMQMDFEWLRLRDRFLLPDKEPV